MASEVHSKSLRVFKLQYRLQILSIFLASHVVNKKRVQRKHSSWSTFDTQSRECYFSLLAWNKRTEKKTFNKPKQSKNRFHPITFTRNYVDYIFLKIVVI